MALRLEGARILVVGQDAARFDDLQRWLERDGARVDSVRSRAAALAALADERYHALVCDLSDEREALALAAEVRGHRRASSIVAIALARRPGTDRFVDAMAAGYQVYLGAPLDVLAAVDVIRHRLATRRE
jgi:DNA-binding NtrC family response regulator